MRDGPPVAQRVERDGSMFFCQNGPRGILRNLICPANRVRCGKGDLREANAPDLFLV